MEYKAMEGTLNDCDKLRSDLGSQALSQAAGNESNLRAIEMLRKSIVLPAEAAFKTMDPAAKLDLEAKVIQYELAVAQAEELRFGKDEATGVIAIGIAALIVLMAIYMFLHLNPCTKVPVLSGLRASAHRAVCDPSVTKEFFVNLGSARAISQKQTFKAQELAAPLDALVNTQNDNLFTNSFGPRLASLRGHISKEDSVALKNTDQQAAFLKEGIEKIYDEAQSLSKSDNFFWIGGFWKWLEIIFAGEIGVLVGIVVWVSTQYKARKYTKEMYEEEWRWYVTEVAVGPVVVVVAFLLLDIIMSSLIAGVTENQIRTSIYLTVGVSFVLGFFVRRTLGILDVIKNKLPIPSSGNQESDTTKSKN
jgi:hypothetical protein